MMDKQELLNVFKNQIMKESKDIYGAPDTWIGGYEDGRVDALEFGYKKAEWLNESEKPEIPQFVADWIEEVKQRGCGLADALNCFVSPIMPEKVKQWIQFDFAAIGCHHDNQELLAKAWLNGYTIEKEPVWVVKAGGSYVTSIDYDFYDWTIGTTINKDDESILTFTDKKKAEAIETLVEGTIEERSERIW